MSVTYIPFKIRKGSATAKMVRRFFDERSKQHAAAVEFCKEFNAEAFSHTEEGVSGLHFKDDKAPAGWVDSRKNRGWFRPSAKKPEHKEILKRMRSLPVYGSRTFTHNDSFLGVRDMFIDDHLRILFCVPSIYGETCVIKVPESMIPKVFNPKAWHATEMKHSELLFLQAKAAEEAETEAQKKPRKKPKSRA